MFLFKGRKYIAEIMGEEAQNVGRARVHSNHFMPLRNVKAPCWAQSGNHICDPIRARGTDVKVIGIQYMTDEHLPYAPLCSSPIPRIPNLASR